jgi:hypothetical protein
MGPYRETFLYRHLSVVADSSESMLVRQSARGLLAEMDEADGANGHTSEAPSEAVATV